MARAGEYRLQGTRRQTGDERLNSRHSGNWLKADLARLASTGFKVHGAKLVTYGSITDVLRLKNCSESVSC